MSTIADLEIIVTSDTGDAEAGLDSVNNKLDSNVVKQGLVGAGMVALSKQGFGFLSGALMDASDFESALTDAYIALGDFEGGMDGLQEVIMDLGEALPFSATEVANLVEELGKLGIAADDIQAVAYSVMSLAAGLGTDLVPTGQAVIKIMNSLGMSMENVDELTNQLFKVLAAGTLDLSSFMEAWKNVGALVKQAGMSFVDAAGFITLLTDAGINASTAGNALARLFSALLKPSEELKAMLSSLGIQFTDLEGNLLPVKDIILNIMDAWDGLTSAEKLDLAELIGGKEYMAELMTLFDQGREKFQEFMEKYNAAMDLQDVIKTKMGTAKAMWDTFTETLGNVKIMIGQQLLPAFKSFLAFITPLIDAFKNIPGPILKVVTIVGVLATAFVGLAGAVGIIMASGALGVMATAFGLMLSPITLLIAGLVALGAKFLLTGDNMDRVKDVVSRLMDTFGTFRDMGLDPVQAALRALGVVFPDLYGHVLTAISIWNGLKSAFSSIVGVVQTVASAIGNFIVSALKMGAVRDILAGVVAGFLAFKGIMGVISIFNSVKTAIMGVRVAMIALNTALLANPFVLIAAAIIGLGVALFLLYRRFEGVRKVVDPVLDVLKALGKWVGGKLLSGFKALMSGIQKVVGFFQNLQRNSDMAMAALNVLGSIVGGVLVGAFTAIVGAGRAFGSWIASIVSTVVSAASAFISWLGSLAPVQSGLESLRNILSNLVSAVGNVIEAFRALFSGDFAGFASNLGEAFKNVATAIVEYMTAVPKMILSAFTSIDWGSAASKVVSLVLAGIRGAGGAASGIWSWLTDSLNSAFSTMRTALGNAISLAWDAITSINWSDYVPKLVWDFFVKAVDLATKVGKLLWNGFVTAVDLTTKVGKLLWSGFVIAVDLAAKVGEFAWSTFVTAVDLAAKVGAFAWSTFVTAVDLAAKVGAFAWKTFVTSVNLAAKVGSFAWKTFVTSVDLAAKVGSFAWSTFVTGVDFIADGIVAVLSWASFIPDIDWTSFIPNLSWPDMPSAGDIASWIKDAILGKFGMGGGDDTATVGGSGGQFSGNGGGGVPSQIGGGGYGMLEMGFNPAGGGGMNLQITPPDFENIKLGFTLLEQRITNFVANTVGVLGGWTSGVQTMMNTFATSFHPPISQGTSAGKQSFITFVADTIAVMGGWIGGMTAMMSTFSASFHPPISMGTSAGKQSFITFVADTIGVMGGWSGGMTAIITSAMSTFSSTTSSGTSAGKQSFVAFVSSVIGVMGGWSGGVNTVVNSTMSNLRSQTSSGTSSGKSSFTSFVSSTIGVMGGWSGGMRNIVSGAMSGVVSAISSGMSSASSAIRGGAAGWSGIVAGYAGAMRGAGVAVGAAAGQGVAAGLYAALGAVSAAANAIIAEVDRAMRAKARIHSPSRMTREIAEYMGEGIVDGLNDSIRPIVRAAGSVVDGIEGALSPRQRLVQDLTNTVAGVVTDSLTDTLSSVLATTRPTMGLEMQSGNRAALAENTYNTTNTTYYITNHYTVNVDDLEDLNEAVEFVRDLPRERELIAI